MSKVLKLIQGKGGQTQAHLTPKTHCPHVPPMEMTCDKFHKFKQQGKCSSFFAFHYSPFPKPLLGEMKKANLKLF